MKERVGKFLLSAKTRYGFAVISILLMLFMLAVAAYSGYKIYTADQARLEESSKEESIQNEPSQYASKRVSSELAEPLKLVLFQFDLDQENNFATWFSAIQLLFCAYLAYRIMKALASEKKLLRICWFLIIIGLSALIVEEVFSIHEFIGSNMPDDEKSLEIGIFSWFEQSRWILVYMIPLTMGAVFLITVFVITFKEDKLARWLSVVGTLLWVNVLILESLMASVPRYLVRAEIFLEESLELAGVLFLIFAFSAWLDKRLTNNTNYRQIADREE